MVNPRTDAENNPAEPFTCIVALEPETSHVQSWRPFKPLKDRVKAFIFWNGDECKF